MEPPLTSLRSYLQQNEAIEHPTELQISIKNNTNCICLIVSPQNTDSTKYRLTPDTYPDLHTHLEPLQNLVDSFTFPSCVVEYEVQFLENRLSLTYTVELEADLVKSIQELIKQRYNYEEIEDFQLRIQKTTSELSFENHGQVVTTSGTRNPTILATIITYCKQRSKPSTPNELTNTPIFTHIQSHSFQYIYIKSFVEYQNLPNFGLDSQF